MDNKLVLKLSALTDEKDENILLAYLDMAESIIANRCYPFVTNPPPIPPKYQNRQLEIAVYLLNKRGAEGETTHNENGINRTYESASVPNSMLRDILPFVGVLGGNDEVLKKE